MLKVTVLFCAAIGLRSVNPSPDPEDTEDIEIHQRWEKPFCKLFLNVNTNCNG